MNHINIKKTIKTTQRQKWNNLTSREHILITESWSVGDLRFEITRKILYQEYVLYYNIQTYRTSALTFTATGHNCCFYNIADTRWLWSFHYEPVLQWQFCYKIDSKLAKCFLRHCGFQTRDVEVDEFFWLVHKQIVHTRYMTCTFITWLITLQNLHMDRNTKL